MATVAELMAKSAPAGLASGLGLNTITAIVPAGTTQAGATQIVSPLTNSAATSSGTGVLLPTAENKPNYVVRNGDASNALLVYPAGTATINLGTAGAAFSIAATKLATFYPDGNNWLANLSA